MIYAGIIAWSLRNRLLVLVAAALLLILGGYYARIVPVDVLPDLTRPTVSIQVEAPGMAPEDTESLLSYPIEVAVSGLPGVERVRSVSSPALSVVYAEFAWGTDPYRNRQLVAERIEAARAQLPGGVQPRIGPLTSLMGEVMLVALQSDDDSVDAMQLRDLADWSLRPALLSVPGVAQVLAIGGESRQYEIRPRPQAMRLLGVTLNDIESAARGFGQDYGAGFADAGGQELSLRSHGRPFRLDELRDVAVAWRGGAAIHLHQVADLAVGSKLKRGDAGADGHAAVILAIQKQPGVNTLALTAELEKRLRQSGAGLPPSVKSVVLFRQADFIEQSVHNVRDALLSGGVIAALVLFAFLLSGRATAVSLVAIPLSVLAAILVLQLIGLSINTMTLGGLAIAVGELVDDAVVGVENVVRRLRQRAAADPVLSVISAATTEVRSGVLYATVIIVLVLLPLFALDGVEGRLFAPLGIAYIAAIAASLVVAITISPVLASFAFADVSVHLAQEARWLQALKRRYLRALAPALRHPRRLIVMVTLVLMLVLLAAAQLPRAFLPAFNEGSLTVNVVLQPGISLQESDRLGGIAERLLQVIPEVVHVGRRTGRAEQDEHAEGVHYSELDIALRPGMRPRSEIVSDIRRRLAVLPASIAIGQPISHRLDHLLSGVRAPLVVKVVGDDLGELHRIAEQVRQQLQQLPGLADVQIEKQEPVPLLDIHVDPRRAAQYGLSAASVQQTLSGLTLGIPLSQIVEGERRYDLVLRLDAQPRDAAALPNLLMDAPAGPVPLSWLADFTQTTGPSQILRENLRRRLVVAAFAATSGFERDSRIAQQRLADLPLPPGYELRVEGQVVAQQQALLKIGGLSLLSLLLMAVVLYGRYRSIVLSLIVLGNVPLALIGGVMALLLTATPLSVASMVGFVTLTGIASRNSILKLSHFLRLARHEHLSFGVEQVLRGSAERLTPVLMTALIAALALLPLLIAGDAPGKEILHPVALVIFGGLLSSTLLDSFMTPLLYLQFGAAATQRWIDAPASRQ